MTSVRDVLTLDDGRELAWAATGPADGRPVLFIAGAASGRSMLFGREKLERLGVLLITVDRPGIGASTPDPERTLDSTTRDLAALAERFGGRLPVVANSQGAPFGLALAASGACERLVLVSPADDVGSAEMSPLLPDELRGLVERVRTEPDEMRLFFADLGAEGMERMVVGGARPEDRSVYEGEAFLAMYRAALAEGFAHGGAGYATDTVIAMSPWELPFGDIPCEVDVLMGELDGHHSADGGETLARRIPAGLTVVPGAGGALLWTHDELVLRTAVR